MPCDFRVQHWRPTLLGSQSIATHPMSLIQASLHSFRVLNWCGAPPNPWTSSVCVHEPTFNSTKEQEYYQKWIIPERDRDLYRNIFHPICITVIIVKSSQMKNKYRPLTFTMITSLLVPCYKYTSASSAIFCRTRIQNTYTKLNTIYVTYVALTMVCWSCLNPHVESKTCTPMLKAKPWKSGLGGCQTNTTKTNVV